jgi:5'-methylthioadenosine phosphorylase
MAIRRVGIIGGSGFYDIGGIKNVKKVRIKTPFGDPSDEYITGTLEGKEIVFLSRHGKGHRILPNELNYRANIYGMKKLGVEWLISISAVGSFKKEIKPLDILIPDQFFDLTHKGRKDTFFGEGIVAHIPFADPVCPRLSDILYNAGVEVGGNLHKGGTYLNMEGPAFSTKAESLTYQKLGMAVIGMTNMPEAKVAREAEICFATLAMVTDYDCWHEEESVTIETVIKNLKANVGTAKKIIKLALLRIPEERTCQCATALKNAIITSPEAIPGEVRKKLSLIIGKYLSVPPETDGEK